MNMEQYRQELMDTAKRLFAVDSPSGFTADVVTLAKELAEAQGYAARRINKGNLAITVPGRDHSRTVGVCAHIDTLGLMCRAITEKGELLFTRIGAHPGRRILPHPHPGRPGVHRHHPVPVPLRPCV